MKSLHIITPVKDSIDTTLETVRAVLDSKLSVPFTYTVYNDFSTPENTARLEAASREMGFSLACKDEGVVYFFSMATSFTKAALGAEGVGKDVNMIIGNGYTKGHAEITLQELREHEGLRNLFAEMYA